MKKNNFSQVTMLMIGIFIAGNFFCQDNREKRTMQNSELDIIQLPAPNYKSTISIEETLQKRRSVREYSKEPLSLSEVSQILWAAQGITDNGYGRRTAPSAGALYPIVCVRLYLQDSSRNQNRRISYLNVCLHTICIIACRTIDMIRLRSSYGSHISYKVVS